MEHIERELALALMTKLLTIAERALCREIIADKEANSTQVLQARRALKQYKEYKLELQAM